MNVCHFYTKYRHTHYGQYNTQHKNNFIIESIHSPGKADGNLTNKLLILHIRKSSNILLFLKKKSKNMK